MSWFEDFIQTAKQFDTQLNVLKDLCDNYNLVYEDKVEDVKYLAKTTTMSNSDALHYAINKIQEDEWQRWAMERTPKNTGEAISNITSKLSKR